MLINTLPEQDVTLHIGDARRILPTLPAESVDCCVTSPPYFGLRDYGHEEQLGGEKTPTEYVESLVLLYREVRRVLKPEGTFWLNIGDKFASKHYPDIGVKKGERVGIPWLVAFALRRDGWYIRQENIWSKPNPMTESVKNRTTTAHEQLFHMAKQEEYFYNADAIREPYLDGGAWIGRNPTQKLKSNADRGDAGGRAVTGSPLGRNKRSVWGFAARHYKGAHFAVFPPDLVRPCIRAGCPPGGVVLDPCGGSGTVAQVALEEKRRAIIVELNPEYKPLIEERVSTTRRRLADTNLGLFDTEGAGE